MADVDTVECAVCGDDTPAAMIDETTVATIEPMTAPICEVCQLVQDHTLPDDVCMQCGDAIGTGFYCEVAFPLGVSALPGNLAGYLCGDCAADIACRINYESVHADPDARDELAALLDEEVNRRHRQSVAAPSGGQA